MTTQEIVNYYANLLILQYLGKPKAYATIQSIVTPVIMPQVSVQVVYLSENPAGGSFVLNYNGNASAPINVASDDQAAIQAKIRAIPGLSSITFADPGTNPPSAQIVFNGVNPVAYPLTITNNTIINGSGDPVTLTVGEVDVPLPLAVQNAYNLLGSDIAVGDQLDVLAKYAGVTRVGNVNGQPVSLDDADFYSLIRLGIFRNNSQSSLAAIQGLIALFFPGEILVFDYQNMRMSYLVSSAIGSLDLLLVAISENLLPKPMGVQLSVVIYAPVITTFFGFRTYSLPAVNSSPFNTYSDYQMDRPWVSYSNAIAT